MSNPPIKIVRSRSQDRQKFLERHFPKEASELGQQSMELGL